MMQCIQELERENAELETQLGQNDAPETPLANKEEAAVESEEVEPVAEDGAA